MRLWHIDLIPYLNTQHLLGQHRECCALRGNGWNKKHHTVNYVFTHDVKYLISYHMRIMQEMQHRGYSVDIMWWCPEYRGKKCHAYESINFHIVEDCKLIYPEHDYTYLRQCIKLLVAKNPQYYSSKFITERR